MGRAKSRRNNRKQSSSTQIVEPESPPAGENLENGKIKKTVRALENQSPTEILSGSNNLGDTQLVDDAIGIDEETQLVDNQYTSGFADVEHDTELGTQLVDESEKEDCSDRDSNGTEIIGRLSDDEGVHGIVSADPNEKVAAASRCLSKHADKCLSIDSDTSTGSTQANSPSIYTSSLYTIPNQTEADLLSDMHSTEVELKEKQVRNENACKDEICDSKARIFFDEDERNKLLFDNTLEKIEDVHSSKLGRGERVPELSYICSQEPGEFSQANALGIVEKLLDTVDGQLYVETVPKRSIGLKMASMSGAKGPQSLARRQDLKNPMESIGTYDWIDSREDEGGGDFFTRRRESFFGNGHGRKSFTEPCISKKLTSGKAENLAKKFLENQKGLPEDHKSSMNISLSDSRISLSRSTNLDIGQVKNAKVIRSLFGNLKKQEHTERLEKLVEPPDHSGLIVGIHDVGVDTQMAAEAMQELGCRSPFNSVCEDIPVISQSAEKESKRFPDSSYLFKTSEPLFTSVNTEELSKQMKCGTRVGGKKYHATEKCPKNSKDSIVEKRSITKRSAKQRCNTMNSARRRKNVSVKLSKCLKGEEDSDETWLYGSSGSVIDLNRSIEPVAHRTRNSIGKQSDKSENVFRNCEDGKSDQLDARITRRTRSSLAVASKRQRPVSSSIPLSRHMLNDAATTTMNKMQQANEEKKQLSSQKKKASACNITSSTYPKQVAAEQMTSGIRHNVKVRRQSSSTNASSPPNIGQITIHLNGAGNLDGGASAPCFPCNGEVSIKKRRPSRCPSAHASMIKKPKDDFVHQKGSKFDTASTGGYAPANVLNEKSPSALQALTTSNTSHCSMNGAEIMKKDKDQFSSVPTTPLKDVDAASPIYTVNGDVTHCYKTRSSMCSLSRELIRLDAIKPELSPILKDSPRKKRDIASIRVLFSHHLGADVIKQQKKILSRLGIYTASSSSDATHFVTDKFVRTRNMLESMALGKPVVTPSWLESCGQACCFIDEKKYILRDAKKEREIGFNMASSLVHAGQKPLLQDHRVLVTQNVKPSKELIITLVKAAHGLVIERVGRSPIEDLLIISCEEDRSICIPLLEKGARAYSSELILNGIVIQKLEFDRHLLFMDNKKTRSSRTFKS
ncbi:uncharacterized protein LOC116254670 isoform X2 [Nymphaea colorata]|uniref:uncharacterized protein LOC116254670 isoform X2 n=1 Tax=Nymphaea colorata TaxID=210225 RepID=UPI00129D985D|nr:uncharacterized protein LOC116254670 isoform X2 [Nymphaea colorata]